MVDGTIFYGKQASFVIMSRYCSPANSSMGPDADAHVDGTRGIIIEYLLSIKIHDHQKCPHSQEAYSSMEER